ncbi:peptidase [Corallococcus sp. H22C18031201]|uniref:M4 family metallopeptidase n=1 Tax=Citreicoccus inhibens TaxID=2849499 RepID=UPI000E74493B|nr:M4 family metallopeptidase [Citreicoccus inhibens]MBU8895259.1 M4 family metallopeptidase [Citreicoccus inhibens]RJS26159.1 peptidase [Corallococcus sp. H22C18031201]
MVEKRVRSALGFIALSMMAGACTDSTPAANQEAKEQKASAALLAGGQTVVAADKDAVPSFITGDLGTAPATAESIKSLQASQLTATLANVAPVFHLDTNDLYLKKAYVGFDGDTHFRYGVRKNGTEVKGAEVRLHARNGKVFAANTNARGDLAAPEKATIAAEAAVSAATLDRSSPRDAKADDAKLVYWRDGDRLLLVYEVRVKGELEDKTPVDDSVLVNALNGDVIERIPHIHSALVRRVYDLKHGTSLPGTLARSEGQPEVADPVVNNNYGHLGTVYNCYNSLFGRDSYDNAGAALISSVHYSTNYVNAYWNDVQMVYGDGDGVNASNLANSLDVTAHELTHAVTSSESDLVYDNESGGLNESMSDIFGAVCEWYSKGKVVDANTWIVGDDVWTPSIPGDGLRYMNNPTQDGDSLDWFADYDDSVDVHYSSGISNLAFYLTSQGGTHPRNKSAQVVVGQGFEKAARIFYKMNVDLLLPNSTFANAKTAAEQAATQLGYDATDAGNAWKAVGVGLPVEIPEHVVLQKNVPVPDLSGARGAKQYFSVTLPEGATDLTFTLSGGTGDADLYVRAGTPPTTSSYDCRPYKAGNNETCAFAAPAQGEWYVMLVGFTAYSGTTLTVTWKGGYINIGNETRIENLEGLPGSSQVFVIEMPEFKTGSGTNTLSVVLGEGEGNADLYVQRGSAPNQSSYDGRSVSESATERVVLKDAPAGRYYIQVFGAKSLKDTTVNGYIKTVLGASYKVK